MSLVDPGFSGGSKGPWETPVSQRIPASLVNLWYMKYPIVPIGVLGGS